MLDLHNHVLFGLDDGCRTLQESKALARAARQAGHRGFVATPHIRAGLFDNTVETIRTRRDETRRAVEDEGLELHLGAEYYFDEHLLLAAKERRLLTLGETSTFVLAELPQGRLPIRWAEVLFELRMAGYKPVIAHPERSTGVASDIAGALEVLSRVGAILQLDLGSLLGRYGASARRAGEELVKRGAYHVAACDLHRPEDVADIVAPARARLTELLRRHGEALVERLTHENPRLILADAPLEAVSPFDFGDRLR